MKRHILLKLSLLRSIQEFLPILVLLPLLISLLISCNTTEPPGNQTLTIKLEDVSCTEAWIQLTTNNLQLPTTINILKNNTVAQTFSLSTQDTLLYIDSLLPNQTYKFKVVLTNNPQPTSYPQPPTSNEVSVTTMDTTSHNFTWQTFTFGDAGAGSSTLYDVAIIDENNIWAVGEIYMLDSLGRPDPNAYNAVHWDGTKWELKRIYTYSACSSIDYAPLKSIYAFAENHIVVTSGGGLWWFDGNKWNAECSINPLLTGAINKLWGSSSSDLYAVGNNGNIAHWDGRKWTKIESGTTLNINDIWGDYNQKTGEWEILAVSGNILHGWQHERDILSIKNKAVVKIYSEGVQWPLSGVWFKPSKKYYVVGSGIYQNQFLGNKWSGEPLDITSYFTRIIRANDINDVLVVGAFGEVLHFNGYSWKSFMNQTYMYGTFYSVDIKGNLVVAVGYNSRQAVIIKGKR
ncbi:MAG TPA: glucosyl transferase [Ignavibacteriaceae bacterium]|nr:glucosyl transferase [Ignavibacteriaceae bacterium]